MPRIKRFKLTEHRVYSGQFYVKWPDGVLSEDFYNLTRAKNYVSVLSETGSRISRRRGLRAPEKLTGAF